MSVHSKCDLLEWKQFQLRDKLCSIKSFTEYLYVQVLETGSVYQDKVPHQVKIHKTQTATLTGCRGLIYVNRKTKAQLQARKGLSILWVTWISAETGPTVLIFIQVATTNSLLQLIHTNTVVMTEHSMQTFKWMVESVRKPLG